MKVCSKCKLELPLEEFHNQKDKLGGKRSHCKACTNTRNLEKYHSCKRTKESHHRAARKHSLRTLYGITPEDYLEMLSGQGSVCAICGTSKPWGDLKVSPKRNKKYFCVDHCHDTLKVRGLLCHPCNVGLGNFKDDPDNLEKAIKYLRSL